MHFANPIFLWLLLVLPVLHLFRRNGRTESRLRFPMFPALKALADTRAKNWIRALSIIRYLTLIFLIVALARPMGVLSKVVQRQQGIDIALVMDTSTSMLAQDLSPNRLDVSKRVMADFVLKRQADRLCLVVFGGEAYTSFPLTLDYGILTTFINRIQEGMAGNGTAIGMALATAVNRLEQEDSQNKIIILLTDGENNAGNISPMTAADIAKKKGIKVYTIGVGKKEGAPVQIDHPKYGKVYLRNPDGSRYLTRLDEGTLKAIAVETGGQYFHAANADDLADVYDTINGLERSDLEESVHYRYQEFFPHFLLLAFILLVFQITMNHSLMMRIP